jgi:uncharacterized protein
MEAGKKIAETENCDQEVVELSALFMILPILNFITETKQLLLKYPENFRKPECSQETIEKVLFVIENISFKNRSQAPANPPIELKIVQDADRIDAIGAIGIARIQFWRI